MGRLIILGTGPSWVECPFDGNEIWAASTALITEGLKEKQFDKVFAFDPISNPRVEESVRIAKERNIPVVSVNKYATEKYPIFDIIREFHTNYFLNTASYMIALAIYRGYTKLRLYGIDQSEGDYAKGKSYVSFWLGVATGRGMSWSGSVKWLYSSSASDRAYTIPVQDVY